MVSPFFDIATFLKLVRVVHPARTTDSPRPGEPCDIDGVVDVVLAAMPSDPQWDWRFQYRHTYPEDNLKYTKMLFEYFLNPEWDDWMVMLVEAPSKEDRTVSKIVAFSVWDISYIKLCQDPEYIPQNPMQQVSERGGANRRDANPERTKAFRESGDEIMERYFNCRYGHGQIHLQILGTHPEYRRHGYGSRLCRWGMDKAREDDVSLTLIASPMGNLLYTYLDFTLAASGIIEIPGDLETNSWDAMYWEPTRVECRNSDTTSTPSFQALTSWFRRVHISFKHKGDAGPDESRVLRSQPSLNKSNRVITFSRLPAMPGPVSKWVIKG